MTINTRRDVADLAIELVGGTTGYTKSHDPFGHFHAVTEGRQTSWTDAEGHVHHYSACQELLSRVLWQLCREKQGMSWCNRVEAGNTWIPGQNLLRIKKHAAYAWLNYGPHAKWDIAIGDGVEIMGSTAHTLIVTEIRYDANGDPASVDVAEYGQFLDPDGSGPAPADHGCRLRVDVPVRRDRFHRWMIGKGYIIGRVDVMAIRERELAGEGA